MGPWMLGKRKLTKWTHLKLLKRTRNLMNINCFHSMLSISSLVKKFIKRLRRLTLRLTLSIKGWWLYEI